MFFNRSPVSKKYFWIELGFLVFLSFGISLISDLEYSAYEEHDISKFARDSGYRFITGSFSLACYAIYYWGFLKKYIFKRKVVAIFLCSAGFVIIDHLINKYPGNWMIVHTDIVSEGIRKRALANLNSTLIFTFNYDLISSIIPLIGLAFVIKSFTQDAQMIELKEQQLLSELNYLKAQIQPHFFFNTLNNIYSLALKRSKDTAPMVAKLGDMMRYILYEADKKTVPLKGEITFLENYVSVEKMRHKAENNIRLDVQNIKENTSIAPLLLLPFIENAFKHGLQNETESGFVNIVLCNNEHDLTLHVTNSKPVSMQHEPHNGIGLNNVIKRLDILYPGGYILDRRNGDDIYDINLTLTRI